MVARHRTDPMKRTTKKLQQALTREPDLAPEPVEERPAASARTGGEETLPDDPLAADEDLDEEEETSETEAETEEAPPDDENAPDDALGLYLRQMGAIPLLSRDQELTLAKRLERQR